MTYDSVKSQSQMALDENRNTVYFAALKRLVTPDTVVLDLGAGLGVLGLFAAKLGAKRVYLVEPEPVIRVAAKLASDNGLSDRVVCLQSKIEEVELPEDVDIIISVFTGNFLLGENLLPLLYLARDRFLKPQGVLLPDAGDMWVVPITAAKLYKKHLGCFDQDHYDLNVQTMRKYVVNKPQTMRRLGHENYLMPPENIRHIDFNTAETANCRETVGFKVDAPAICHGFLGWFSISLDKQVLSNAPDEKNLHWSPILFFCDQPIELTAGEQLNITVIKTEQSPWVWRFQKGQEVQSLSELHTRINPFNIPKF